MAEYESTMQWKVDVTQFTKAMQEAKKALSDTNSEFKMTTSTMGKWSSSTDGIEAKVKQLGGQIEANTRIMEVYQQAWEEAKNEFGEASPEAERLAKKIEDQQIKINKAQVQLGTYTDKLNMMQEEQRQSESATSQLNKQIEDQQEKVNKLKQAYKDSLVGDNPEEAKELAKQLEEASSELAKMKKQMNDADKAADDLDYSMVNLDDTTRSVSDGFTVMKGALANLVSQGISRVIEGVKDLAKQTFDAGATFESSMSNVQAISGATASEMEMLTAKAEEMGAKTKFSASESADAFSYMAMAGWKTKDMLGGIEGIMNLAAASGADLATTSDIVTDALTAMGYSASDAGRLADVMAAASSNANTNVELMGATFQYAAPIVGALGYSMEDTAVAIGLMANAGIKGEKAGTALRSILTRLSAPPKECETAMKKLGISLTDGEGKMKTMEEVVGELRTAFSGLDETSQTAYAKQIAGQEAMSGLLAIVRAAPEDYDKLTKAVANSTGAAENMANVMNDNVSGQITLLKSKIEGIMIKVFDKASGSIRKAIDTISNALDDVDWNKFSEQAGKAAEKVADLFEYVVKNGDNIITVLKTIATAFITYKAVTTITAVVGAFQKLSVAVKAGQSIMAAFNSTMMLNPYALIAAGIAGIVVLLNKYAKKQREALEAEYGLNEEQRESIDTVKSLTDQYNLLNDARNEQVSGINAEFGYLNELKTEYNGLIDSNGKVKEGYEDRANFILTTLADAMGVELDDVKKLIDSNGKLGESIDEVLRKKQAEATLAANEQIYTDAIAKRGTALDELTKAQKAVDEAEQKMIDTNNKAQDVWDNYYDMLKYAPDAAGSYLNANWSIIEANEIAQKSYQDAQQDVKDAEQAWIGYNSTIQNYEGLSAAIISGDATKIQEALQNMQYNFITAETGNRESLERQVQNYQTNLDNLKQAIENGTPSVTQEMVDQAQSMVDAAKKEVDKLPPELADTGDLAGREHARAVGDTAGANQTAGQTIGDAANTGAETGDAKLEQTGADGGKDHAKGVESTKGENKTAGEDIAKEAKKGAESVETETSGENFGLGFIKGIGAKLKDAWNKGWELAVEAQRGLKEGQAEGSPSKLTRRSGVYFGEGYADGIMSMVKPVTSAASNMAKSAVSALGEDMSSQMKLIGIDSGNSLIEGMNTVMPNLSGSIGDLKAGVASANATMTGVAGTNVGTFASGSGDHIQNVTFNQYNNSPKAISRLDVYRETNSLLFGAKVRLGNV